MKKPAKQIVILITLALITLAVIFYFTAQQSIEKPNNIEELEKVTFPPSNDDRIVLTVNTSEGSQTFTLFQIESLGMKRLKTTTFWKEDDGVYEGVLLKDLLEHTGLENSKSIRIIALDDYSTKISKREWETWPIILATRRDGNLISIKEKGPTRVIYPRDIDDLLKDENMLNRWIWAIKIIEDDSDRQ